jgi:transposase
MKVYSLDMRTKVVESVSRGVSIRETARRFGVNRSTVGYYLKPLKEEGSLIPKKASDSPTKLDGSAMRHHERCCQKRRHTPYSLSYLKLTIGWRRRRGLPDRSEDVQPPPRW